MDARAIAKRFDRTPKQNVQTICYVQNLLGKIERPQDLGVGASGNQLTLNLLSQAESDGSFF